MYVLSFTSILHHLTHFENLKVVSDSPTNNFILDFTHATNFKLSLLPQSILRSYLKLTANFSFLLRSISSLSRLNCLNDRIYP